MRLHLNLGLLLFSLSLLGCANVTFHTDPALKKKTGLKFYYAKPYVLVTYTGSKDAPVKVDMISLPDLAHPTYAVYHSGWGTHTFSLASNANGTLSSYGQTADSKGPETLNAIAGLLTSAATGYSTAGAAYKSLHNQSALLDPVTQNIREAIRQLSDISTKPAGDFATQQGKAGEFVQELGKIETEMANGNLDQRDALNKLSSEVTAQKIGNPPANSSLASHINDAFDKAAAALKQAVADLDKVLKAPPEVAKPAFALFEIRMEGKTTHIVPVDTAAAEEIMSELKMPDGK